MANNQQIKHYRAKAGMPPGSLVYTGDQEKKEVRITLFDYDENKCLERQCKTVDEALLLTSKTGITWINIDGLHDVNNIEQIGKVYRVHPLAQEDILNISQRAKCDFYDQNIFIVLKMLRYDDQKRTVKSEQVSLVLGDNYVISFQERVGDVFDGIRDRIRFSKGRIRKMSADYLTYAILDAIVDNYFAILENLGENINELQEKLIQQPSKDLLREINTIKRELLFLRKSIWPLRELVNSLFKSESDLINDATALYFRDLYDHTIQIIDTVETYRDMASGMMEMYLSSLSNRMNEVMKTLTIIATIFMPLSFIAGVYGMNFKNIPELDWQYSYFVFWGLIVILFISMSVYFKRKKWL